VTAGPDADDLLDLAVRAAQAAGELLRERAGHDATGIAAKSSRTDLVSDSDRDAEALIIGLLREARPRDAVTAEEGDELPGGGTGVRWLVDPLDGTINFLWGIPQWSVSVAAEDAAGPLVAVVHDGPRGETFRAARGGGAFLGDRSLRMEPGPPLEEALVATGFHYRADERVRQAARLTHVLPVVRDVRRFGSAALDLAWLAAGRVDAYYETGLNPWDWAAGRLLVTEAGGAVREVATPGDGPDTLVAAGSALIDPLCALVREAG
jgi:myo-inositol-1(or 4)-monophosphatase